MRSPIGPLFQINGEVTKWLHYARTMIFYWAHTWHILSASLRLKIVFLLSWVSLTFFFWNLGYSILPKNAPPLGTRAPESLSHIQTHLILNTTIACCITHPAVHLYPPSQWRRGRHGTWPQCITSCVKIATSNPVILMFDSHRWVLRRLSSSKGYDVQPWLLKHRKRKTGMLGVCTFHCSWCW